MPARPRLPKKLGGYAWGAGHAIANHGDDALRVGGLDALNLTARQLPGKSLGDDIRCTFRHIRRDCNAYRVFGTRLPTQRNGTTGSLAGCKKPVCSAGYTDHAGALEIDQCHARNGGNAFDPLSRPRVRADPAAGMIRIEAVADDNRDIIINSRPECLRMNDLGAEIRKFHCFVV